MKELKFVLNENLFYVDGFLYGVDNDAEIKQNDWCIENGKYLYQATVSGHGILLVLSIHKKIIFSNNPSLKLPRIILPDDEMTYFDLNTRSIESKKQVHSFTVEYEQVPTVEDSLGGYIPLSEIEVIMQPRLNHDGNIEAKNVIYK